MLRSEQDTVRRIVREELDVLLVEIVQQASLLDVGPSGDTPVYVIERLAAHVRAVRGLPDKSDDARTEENPDGT